ncbi:piggyBac transposable element-derived protein 3 [Trichonephila inaurata madagascariensis]|uniref:PiggyBac transposable element-derived protein 3 n=1 Tax=Trichonephila inaurata madagascariensis TaxID=2747483 RepID=A0A8X7CHT9_9ARAC|nr:piggyBac transposable element-derived protein 3 [Trichonephila inaurata madagascariensis]
MSRLNENFKKCRLFTLHSIDKSVVLFKGRPSLKQFNPKKLKKRRFKLWCRADWSGYMYQFGVYQGHQTDTDKSKKEFGQGGKVVDEMTKSLSGKNPIIILDNYFSSTPLFEYLKTKQK